MKYEIEFPTEPPVGHKVTDKAGQLWIRTEESGSHWLCVKNYYRDLQNWNDLLKFYGPVQDYVEPVPKGTVEFSDGKNGLNPAVRHEKNGGYRYVEYNPYHKWWEASNEEEVQANIRTWYT